MTMLSWWSTLLFLLRSQLTSWCRFFIVTSCTRIGWLCADYLQVFISSISECFVYIWCWAPILLNHHRFHHWWHYPCCCFPIDWTGEEVREGGEKETNPHKTTDSLFHCQISTVNANILENHLHLLKCPYCSIASNFLGSKWSFISKQSSSKGNVSFYFWQHASSYCFLKTNDSPRWRHGQHSIKKSTR